MELMETKDIQIEVKTINSDGILVRNTKEFNDKGEEIKTTEYFLDVDGQIIDGEIEQSGFVAVGENCDGSDEEHYIAVEVENPGDIHLNEKNVISWSEICRICANTSNQFVPIFTDDGVDYDLCNKINSYLPVKVSEDDTLPHQVCYNCAATLLAWHELFKGCINAHQRLTELQTRIITRDELCHESTEEENNENLLQIENVAKIEPVTEDTKMKEDGEEDDCNTETARTEEESEENNEADNSSSKTYKYMCGVCEEIYNEELELICHLKKQHNVTTARNSGSTLRYECNVCGKSFSKKCNLVVHARIHERKLSGEDALIESAKFFDDGVPRYRCPDCQHVFSTKHSWTRHRRVHTDERPIICHICAKSFRIITDLKRHISDVHHKIKRYACDICNKCFAAKATRDAHRRIHTGEKPFCCDVCGKNFRSINLLGIHKRIHRDYRPHKCSHCEKAFRDKQKLAAHEAIHTGVRPYPCDICGRLFAAKGEATRHRSVHFDEKPHLCAACGLGFRLSRYLRNHIKQHHSSEADAMIKALDKN